MTRWRLAFPGWTDDYRLARTTCFMGLGTALAHRGAEDSARAADAALEAGGELGAHFSGMGYSALTHTAFAAGDSDNRELISNASVVRQKSR